MHGNVHVHAFRREEYIYKLFVLYIEYEGTGILCLLRLILYAYNNRTADIERGDFSKL